MSRIEEIDKIVDEIGDAYSLYEFAECVYEDRQRIAELQKQLEEKERYEKDDFEDLYYKSIEQRKDLEAKLAEAQKPKEIRFNGFVVDCNYDEARKVLQEDILKMWEENKKLKESEELSNYAKCILKNKKLEEDLELSKKCCVEYEQEIQQLKQQLAEKEKIIQMKQNIKRYDIGEMLTENTKLNQQLKSQPAEIVEKIRKELGLKLKYKLNDEVSVLKICNKINEVLDTILKEYQK